MDKIAYSDKPMVYRIGDIWYFPSDRYLVGFNEPRQGTKEPQVGIVGLIPRSKDPKMLLDRTHSLQTLLPEDLVRGIPDYKPEERIVALSKIAAALGVEPAHFFGDEFRFAYLVNQTEVQGIEIPASIALVRWYGARFTYEVILYLNGKPEVVVSQIDGRGQFVVTDRAKMEQLGGEIIGLFGDALQFVEIPVIDCLDIIKPAKGIGLDSLEKRLAATPLTQSF